MMERLEKQMEFILEVDKVKKIVRQTYLSDASRKENDAEHSWHLALMAVLLKEYSNEEVDLAKVIPMVLIHDLVEIDAGDTYAYDEAGAETKRERETKAADRIFGLLPGDQGTWFRELWEEFEAYRNSGGEICPCSGQCTSHFFSMMHQTDEAGQNMACTKVRFTKRNEHTSEGSREIWEYMKKLVDKHIQLGHVIDD